MSPTIVEVIKEIAQQYYCVGERTKLKQFLQDVTSTIYACEDDLYEPFGRTLELLSDFID